jgi:S-adenosylmethionine decarboxylase
VKPEDWGLSGFVLIAESHISIHTFPEKSFVSVDIFSCKHFDSDFASSYLKKTFEMEKVECTVLDRGTEFPKTIHGAAHIVRNQRRRAARPARAVAPTA